MSEADQIQQLKSIILDMTDNLRVIAEGASAPAHPHCLMNIARRSLRDANQRLKHVAPDLTHRRGA
jgi:hypothetical protein